MTSVVIFSLLVVHSVETAIEYLYPMTGEETMLHICAFVFKEQLCVYQIMCWPCWSVEAHQSPCGAGGL